MDKYPLNRQPPESNDDELALIYQLGIALVKRIIEVHGGRIWIESEGDNGSTFLFTLPAQP